jgi:hypothetical protein
LVVAAVACASVSSASRNMMHVADGTFSCGARTAASIGPTAIPGWSQIDRLLLRMSPFVAQSRHGATSDLSPLCTKERKPLVRISAAKALAQFGGVTPAVGKTPRQTAPQRSSVVAHFSDTKAMLPLASRARPTARPVRATYRFAGDQTLLSGDTSVASCGNFPNHHSWHATPPHFFRGELCHQAAE